MFKLVRISLLVAMTAGLMACGPGKDNPGNGDGGPPSDLPDADGDGIADVDEGRANDVDTDGDGTPDYLDDDSDGDGIPDYREAGDNLTGTPPIDTDGDGTPDFRDLDSDDNGISDTDDGVEDLDGDGRGNFQDLDDDGDTLLDEFELQGLPDTPPDTDGDGTPDYHDLDSDADTIGDIAERGTDPDMDNIPSYLDDDSDGDCIPDSLEAGDSDLATPPKDTDGDGRADYIDLDSDNDGLADGAEDANCNGMVNGGETSATNGDSDGDGVSDLVEGVAGTDPNNASDNPSANGDFFFLVPYQDPTTPPDDTLEFRTSVQFADLYFNFDITGSMTAEIAAMANTSTGVPAIISQLTCAPTGGTCTLDSDCATGVCFNGSCITDPLAGSGCVPDLWTGVGRWSDGDTYRNIVSLQSNPTTTANNVDPGSYPGGAEPPSQGAACVADPSFCANTNTNCASSGVGCAGFRQNAVRILIQLSDADNQCNTTASCAVTPAIAGAALAAKDIKFIGLYGTDDNGSTDPLTPQGVAEAIGVASGTVDTSGNPFVYPAIDAAVVSQTKAAVLDIVRNLPLDVTIDKVDDPGDDGDSLQFIDYLEVNISGTGNCTLVNPVTDTDADGHDDAFPGLRPGTPVCWDVHPIPQNNTVPATDQPQVFIATLTVKGDGSTLDSRQVYFLIPPVIDNVPIN